VTLPERIRGLLDSVSPRPLLLAHHYQRDSIVALADHRGDSLELARFAARESKGRDIIFCGVHFMAETADILTSPCTRVFMPDPGAGCPLAGMADLASVITAWKMLSTLGVRKVVPVTYVNSGADLKAFCGRNGGVVCTSSNAAGALTWALQRGETVFFFPDRHLGGNTARALGVEEQAIVQWDRDDSSPARREKLRRARVILWPGFCPIHHVMLPADVARARARLPGCRVIVHPECRREVVEASDLSGSTGRIIREVMASPPGSSWAVGTEVTLVRRLAREAGEGRKVIPLSAASACPNMAKNTLPKLHRLAAGLAAGAPPSAPVTVDRETAAAAKVALDRMLEIA
jgi:quinolinate synthase